MQLQHDRKISPARGEFVLRLLHASGIYCLTKTHLMWSSQSALQQQRAKWEEQEGKARKSQARAFSSGRRSLSERTGMEGAARGKAWEGAPNERLVHGMGFSLPSSRCSFSDKSSLLAPLKGEGPARGSVPPSPRSAALCWLLGSLNPCPLPPLPATSLPRIEPKHPGVVPCPSWLASGVFFPQALAWRIWGHRGTPRPAWRG